MTSRARASATLTSRRASTPRTFPRPPNKVSSEQYNPSHRHRCQSWLIIAGTQASLRHFVIVTLIILKDVFLGKDILCCTVKSNYWRLTVDAASVCSLAMIYKWESICYNWVSSRLTSLIFCCSSSASPHPSLAFSEEAFLALCDNWIKIFFWQLKYCSVAFLSTAYLGYSRAFTVSHNTWRSLNYIMMTGYLLENFKGFGKTMKALNERVFRFVFNIM